jgi:hypothetical protein
MSDSANERQELDRLRADCERLRKERDEYRSDIEQAHQEKESARATQANAIKDQVSRELKTDFTSWLKKQGIVIGILLTIASAGGVIKLLDVMESLTEKQVSKSVVIAVEGHRNELEMLRQDLERLRSRTMESVVDFKDDARKALNDIGAEKERVLEHGRKTREEMTTRLADLLASSSNKKDQPEVSATAPPGTGNEVLFGSVPLNVVAISAAKADQFAADSSQGSQSIGLFSLHFQRALANKSTDANSDGIISWREAVEATARAMAKDSHLQTPVIEGTKSDDGLFAATQNKAAKKFATAHVLLIGINDYAGGFNLFGAVNDVKGFARLLEKKDRVLAQTIDAKYLTDAKATESSIRAEISNMLKNSGPNDICIIYFSGHALVEKEGDQEIAKSFIPHDYDPKSYHGGISIPGVISELGQLKGIGVVIVDG